MRRVLASCLFVLLTMTAALAAQEARNKQQAPSNKPVTFTGIVSMLTTDSLAVKAKTGEVTFAITKATRVIGVGDGRRSAELKRRGKPALITEFVGTGDTVEVSYHDEAKRQAAIVRILKKAEL